jgi:ABC-2 type transport system ATP-binding protein
VLLDEPTAGLDPQATIELLETIRNLKDRNVSVLLSSHMLERVQSVCDRVALFNKGSIVLIGTVPELGRRVLGGAASTSKWRRKDGALPSGWLLSLA